MFVKLSIDQISNHFVIEDSEFSQSTQAEHILHAYAKAIEIYAERKMHVAANVSKMYRYNNEGTEVAKDDFAKFNASATIDKHLINKYYPCIIRALGK